MHKSNETDNQKRINTAAAVTVEALENRQLMSTYYVATTGADTAAGSIAAPLATLNKALTKAVSGDTIIMRGGTYTGGQTVTKPNITIQGFTGESVKIVSPTNNANVYFGLDLDTEASGTVLRNLDISGGYYYALKTETTRDYDNTAGTYHAASNVLIDNVKLHDSGTHVVKLSPDSDHITIQNSEIYNSGRRDSQQGQGIDAVNVDDLWFKDNYIHDTTQNAIFVKGGSQRAVIEYNKIVNAGFGGILLGQDTDAGAFDTTQNPGMYEAIDCVARYNIISGTKYGGLQAWSSLRSTFVGNWVEEAGQIGQAGIFVSMDAMEKPNKDVTFTGNTVGVQADDELISIVPGALQSGLTMSNQKYYGTDRIYDGAWQGTVAQWKTHSGTDTGSAFQATGRPPAADTSVVGPRTGGGTTVVDPGMSGVTITSTVNENGTATLAGTITNPGSAMTLVIDWGDGSGAQTVTLASGAAGFSQTHKYVDDGPTATAQDTKSVGLTLKNSGATVATATTSILVKNVAPTLSNVAITSALVENGTATLSGTITDPGTADTFSLVVNWGDGTSPQTFTYAAGTTTFSQTHKYLDDNAGDSYTVSMTLSDDDTGSATASKTIAVTNAAPTLTSVLLTPIVADNGVATLTGVIGDVGTKDTFTLLIDWGDGSAAESVSYAAGTTNFSRTHTYANATDANLALTANVTLQDDDGGSASASKSITVTSVNAAPLPTLSGVTVTANVNEGSNATLAGTIVTPGTDALQLQIDWGDGSDVQTVSLASGASSFSITHKYADDGVSGTNHDTASIGVTLLSNSVATSIATASVNVKNVAPTLTNVVMSTPDANGVSNLTGTIGDASTSDSFSLVVDWGDGSQPQTYTFAAGTTSFNVSHGYSGGGLSSSNYQVGLTLSDDDGGSATASANVTVAGDGILKIDGTDGNDAINIDRVGNQISVSINGTVHTYNAAQVQGINVDAGAGNDIVFIGDGLENVYVFGGDGDDKIIDGDGSNVFSGGAGKDIIYGGGGADRLNGNGGNDKLLGEAGADRLYGGDGTDYCDGGSSGDRFYSSDGADTYMGQSGDDKFYLHDGIGNQQIFGGSGKDWADVDSNDAVSSIEALAA